MAQIKGALATDIGFFMSEILKYPSILITFHPIKGITFSMFEIFFVSQHVLTYFKRYMCGLYRYDTLHN